MSHVLNDAALDQLFRTARTQNAFLDTPVEDSQLQALYELLKWAPRPPTRARRALCS